MNRRLRLPPCHFGFHSKHSLLVSTDKKCNYVPLWWFILITMRTVDCYLTMDGYNEEYIWNIEDLLGCLLAQSCLTLCDHMDCSPTRRNVACQAPLYMEFSSQYCIELPFSSPGYLPDLGITPRSPTLQADSLPSEPPDWN